jgi:opacity protein-like surface antigen
MNANLPGARSLALVGFVGFSLVVTPVIAQQEDAGFYIGVSHGETEFFNDTSLCEEFSGEVEDALGGDLGSSFLVSESFAELVFATECRQRVTDDANKVYIGYRFSRSVAVELSHIDFGTAGIRLSTDVTAPSGTFRGEAEVSVDVTGLSLAGLFGLPLGNRFSVYARLGVLDWEADGRGTATGSVPDGAGGRTATTEQFVASESGADVHYGVGARFRVTDHVAVRAEWERYEIADLNVLSAGLEYAF